MIPLKHMWWAALPAWFVALSLCCAAGEEAAADDPLLRALAAELERSLNMRLEGLEPPYFIQYVVDDSEARQMSAAWGALASSDRDRARVLSVEVRVGSYQLDNTNFSGGGGQGFSGRARGRGFGRMGGAAPLPLDDDEAAIRHAIWLATDGPYKRAVETLTDKRAFLKERESEERPPDFAPAAPVVQVEPRAAFEMDVPAWEDRLRRLSAVFAEFRGIQDSSVRLTASAGNRILLNSEGSRLRTGAARAVLTITARAQADDGERLADRLVYVARTAAALPDLETLLADARGMAARLVAQAQAPILADYTGPVLFDDVAAPQLFRQLLAAGLAAQPDPVGEGRRRFRAGESLEKSLGKRVLPDSFRVVDDPSQAALGARFLAGHYLFDEEGVPAKRVDLVLEGSLKDLLASRVPSKAKAASNGHGRRSGQAGIGCLFIEAAEGRPQEELKQALIAAARDQGLEFALRVSSLGAAEGGAAEALAAMFGAAGQGRRGAAEGGAGVLADPVRVVKVYVEDGREEPVRGCEFGEVDLKVLKDILAAGDQPVVHNEEGVFGPASSVIAPAVLLEELELYPIEAEPTRKPLIAAPHARAE
ncbi:MAG: hypothetical protein HY812_12500 [Planctomycetes bacterium]|nr:hypothetical protein [Planctomycetota bacterium]